METYVFNIGFNKSGSTSLTIALNILGIPTLHYDYRAQQNSMRLHCFLLKNKENNQRLFYGLDDTYRGFSDFRGERYFRELYAQYPNSKFILTIRPLEDWLRSTEISLSDPRKNLERIRNKIRIELYNEKKYIKYYRNYKKQIRKFFKDKPDQFLELRICEGEGWPELCSFLNLDRPNVDFPRENITDKFALNKKL